ncbi:MAG: hypothetical protein EPN85_13210 [Bacteroidetes bacterium]|nr:MAG: hypothetical protein EPN85_13210 [Bacteroidota bacterium]
MKKNLTICFLMLTLIVYGQDTVKETNTHKGEFSFGVRSTGSLFSASGNYFGIGAGWQFRYRIADKMNTEGFGDWIVTDIGGLGQRFDAHIGGSWVNYPGKRTSQKNRFTPYILGGFCGDYTKIKTNLRFDDIALIYLKQSKDRWSFATQLGLGAHYNITERFDISFSTQYVLHFGKDIDAKVQTNTLGVKYLQIQKEGNALEGHLFLTISANCVIADLNKK